MEQKWKDLKQAQGMDESEVTAAEAVEVPGRHAVQGETAEEKHQRQELPDQGHRGLQPHLM